MIEMSRRGVELAS